MSKHNQSSLPLSPNAGKWAKWVAAKDATGELIDFAAGQALLNPPVIPPESNFLFELHGGVWPGWRHNNAEHANNLTGEDRDAAFANLNHANQLWNMEGRENSAPLACYPFVNGALDIAHPILSTTSWPSEVLVNVDGFSADTSTDAGVLAYCSNTRMPGPNPDAPPFPHPGG